MREHRAMLKTPAKEHVRSQKGNVVVEFALILPLFLTLVFGMIFYSIALLDKTILTMAAQQGARAGAISSSTSSAQTVALAACQNNLISIYGPLSATITPAINSSTNMITVAVSCSYPGFYIFSGINLSAQTIMRLESP